MANAKQIVQLTPEQIARLGRARLGTLRIKLAQGKLSVTPEQKKAIRGEQ